MIIKNCGKRADTYGSQKMAINFKFIPMRPYKQYPHISYSYKAGHINCDSKYVMCSMY